MLFSPGTFLCAFLHFLIFFFFLFLIDLVGDPLFFSIWPFLLPFVFHQLLYESAIESVQFRCNCQVLVVVVVVVVMDNSIFIQYTSYYMYN